MDITRASLDRLAAAVCADYAPDSPTHDHTHLRRVAALATKLCASENGDQSIAICAAWLHDLHREVRPDGQFFVSPEAMDDRAIRYLDEAGVPAEAHAPILDAVHYTDRFSFSDRPTYQASVEARCVRDADNLDAIGAIGIARAFTFGGGHDIPIYDDSVATGSGEFSQDRRPPSTIHHFHDKLLRLPEDLETGAAQRLASHRAQYMSEFLRQFMSEWDEDLSGADPGRT